MADLRARLAWTLTAVTAVAVVADALVVSRFLVPWSEESMAVHGFPIVSGAVLGCAAMGALIISRQPGNPVGWLLNLIGVLSSIGMLAEALSLWIVNEGGPGPRSVGSVAGWLSMILAGPVALAGISLIFLLAPSGRFLSVRWRRFAAIPATGTILCGVTLTLLVPASEVDLRDGANLRGIPQALWGAGLIMITVGLVGSLISMLLRLRRSDGVQRQQLRVVALAAALVTAGFLTLIVTQELNGGRQTWVAGLPLFLSYFCLPLLFAIAVLRFRLYDIEVFVNRSLILASGTAFAALGYIGIVVSAGRLVDSRSGGFWLSLLATVVVALAFQPIRHHVVMVARRLAFGPRAEPYKALAQFSHQLSTTPSAELLLETVAQAAGQTVSAAGAAARLEVPGVERLSATWVQHGTPSEPPETFDVVDGGLQIGTLQVWPARGAAFSDSDRQMLLDIAAHAGVVFRNIVLERQLEAEVETLTRTTRALADSRRRIVEAEDVARRRLESAISAEVLPRLRPMVTVVRNLGSEPVTEQARAQIDDLVRETNTALESMRELTRGVFPTMLASAGVAPALGSFLAREGSATTLSVHGPTGVRYPDVVEAAAYFVCAEAERASPEPIAITIVGEPGVLAARVAGSLGDVDRRSCTDRVEAAGGSIEFEGRGSIHLTFPASIVATPQLPTEARLTPTP